VCTRKGMMSDSHSDAVVFFGATGDLAHKKIFPSLHAMLKRGPLDVPAIGVGKSGWNLDQFRARDYVEEAWRIVDPMLKADTPVYEYQPGTWGLGEVDRTVSP
jgi:glucose-6-phosphate 1-dehydrogenase